MVILKSRGDILFKIKFSTSRPHKPKSSFSNALQPPTPHSLGGNRGDHSRHSTPSPHPMFTEAIKFGEGHFDHSPNSSTASRNSPLLPLPLPNPDPMLIASLNKSNEEGFFRTSIQCLNIDSILLANPSTMANSKARINKDPLDAMEDVTMDDSPIQMACESQAGDLQDEDFGDTFLNLEPIQEIEMSSESFKRHRVE
ncbi:hypothetical protein Cgig2_034072 [Carnegiea gigantea]|uniref:Uncharacterized protein n=1 Tax=Carnegiea gigantea TaxID=171969 RepID=A0A9Q1Q4L5_9CARY|nr:hypothetical protein Cgig2_034072 [Carnegiea gigantea]